MKTLGDVKKLASEVETHIVLFGATEGTAKEVQRRFREVGRAICRENQVFSKEAASLPADTPLSSRSQKLAGELERWFRKNAIGSED